MRGTVDNELHHSQCCQKPLLHHHLETETRKTVLDQTDGKTVWTFQTIQIKFSNNSNKNAQISHLSHQHLIYKHSESPPVHGPRVRRVCQNLWSQKLWSPTERTGPVPETHTWERDKNSSDKCSWLYQAQSKVEVERERKVREITFFTQSKVSDLHVTICVKQQVVQFKISGGKTQKYMQYVFKKSLDKARTCAYNCLHTHRYTILLSCKNWSPKTTQAA